MSEKIYALLLRLYPADFRKAYGEEALLLFRDRTRDERGVVAKARLWFDLLGDLAISVPRAYRAASAARVVSAGGAPSFLILEDEAPGLGSLAQGGMATLLVYGCMLILLGHAGRPFPASSDANRLPRHSGALQRRLATVTLTYLPAHPAPGAMVTLTAKVVGDEELVPTGHVRFSDGGAVLKYGTLSDGAVIVKARLPRVAEHTIRVIYYGDLNYAAAASNEDNNE